MTAQTPNEAANQFLSQILKFAQVSYISIFTLPGEQARFFHVERLREATEYAVRASERLNVYHSCGLLRIPPDSGRGPSADVGTVLEMGIMVGLGRPVIGYTDDAQDYVARLDKLYDVIEEPLSRHQGRIQTPDGLMVEDYGLADTLMVAAAILDHIPTILEDFESAVLWARRLMADA